MNCLLSFSVGFFGDQINLINFVGCCIVFGGVILYKVNHFLEKRKAEAEHNNAAIMDKDLSEDGSDDDMLGRNDRLPLRVEKPDSGLDLNGFLDEDSGRWSEHQDGIEMGSSSFLRSRGSDAAQASPKPSKMLIV